MTSAAPRILLIEDDASIRRFVRLALEDEGWQVFESETARRGLIEAASRQPDAVVLDLGLPDADGKTVIAELRGWSEPGYDASAWSPAIRAEIHRITTTALASGTRLAMLFGTIVVGCGALLSLLIPRLPVQSAHTPKEVLETFDDLEPAIADPRTILEPEPEAP